MKRIAILGSTGSIGTQALEVIAAYPDRFVLTGLAAGKNAKRLADQARRFCPAMVAIDDHNLYPWLRDELADTGIEVLAGAEGVAAVACHADVDQVLAAMIGAAGMAPTLAAVEAGKHIALANKETMVAAGALITAKISAAGVSLLPVDSEHSAIFQCLQGTHKTDVEKIILTASGGPFRNCRPAKLDHVTLEQALQHPNWSMGNKITIDSATLINKGLEVIEAHWLFGFDYDRIEVMIHPQSIVHSLVELIDGTFLAQLGAPDMHVPIAYALSYPERLSASWPKLSGLAGLSLEFQAPDHECFPALSLAYDVGRRGGTYPAVMNAANEVAVSSFLQGDLKFNKIVRIVAEICGNHGCDPGSIPDLEEILAADAWARQKAAELIRRTKE